VQAVWEFDGGFRFTRLGTGYVVFTTIVGFAAVNTGNNSLYIGLAMMLAGLIVSGIVSSGALRGIAVELSIEGEVWAGRAAPVRLVLANRSRYALRDLVVTAPGIERQLHLAVAAPRSEASVEVRFVFPRRGRVSIAHVDVYTRFPFGLFLLKRRRRLAGETIIYPRILEGVEAEKAWGEIGTEAPPREMRVGSGTEVFAYRDYSRGDSLRNVHWRKSASLGRWVIKQTAVESAVSVMIVVDPYLPPGTDPEAFERMISAAATWIRQVVSENAEVTLQIGRSSRTARNRNEARPLFDSLALVEPAPHSPPVVARRGAVVFTLRRADAAKSA
jgi:uncharacterized protein (DUF58 family)